LDKVHNEELYGTQLAHSLTTPTNAPYAV